MSPKAFVVKLQPHEFGPDDDRTKPWRAEWPIEKLGGIHRWDGRDFATWGEAVSAIPKSPDYQSGEKP